MYRRTSLVLMMALAGSLVLPAADEETNITFKSDVALVRVDVQVLDRDNRAITGLKASDFILTEQGKRQEIRNFATENMPLDVLFLLDVSASMRPHIQRISDAAHQAFQVLGKDDRIGIMIFDTNARVRMPFKTGVRNAEDGLERVLDQENFRGGTHITDGLLEAASYMRKEARKDARRAIIIVTDDMSQDRRDEASINRALTRADAVLCALIAPDAMQQRGRGGYPGGGNGGGRGGMGGGIGGLGGIILGGGGMGGNRGGMGGGRNGGGGYGGGQGNHSAGTREIARSSGGDDMRVQDADSLETTLSRLRHRYALHFYAPANSRTGEERTIDVQLASAAIRRYPDADVRFRRVYLSPGGGNGTPAASDDSSSPAVITRAPATSDPDLSDRPVVRRRPMVDGSGGHSDGPLSYPGSEQPATSSGDSSAPASAPPAATPADGSKSGGWRRVTAPPSPGQQP